jgi:hypothetical protein
VEGAFSLYASCSIIATAVRTTASATSSTLPITSALPAATKRDEDAAPLRPFVSAL